MRTQWIVCAGVTLLASACAGSQGEEVRDARMEQAEARADANETAVEEQATAREDVIEQRHEQHAANIENRNAPGEEASEDMADITQQRAEFRSEAKEELDKLAVRISAAEEKLLVLGGRAPTQLKGEFATTLQQYKTLERDVTDLEETPPVAWESTTEAIDKRMATLDDRVEELTDAIDDV
jgi:chromosome segregation ATPase